MKNKEYYKDKIYEITCEHAVFAIDRRTGEIKRCARVKCGDCLFRSPSGACDERARNWLEQEYVEPVLTDKEKRYLENVLRPFRDRVEKIIKKKYLDDYEYLHFYVTSLGNFGIDSFYLPLFKRNTAYLGMEQDKCYTLEELGLFADEEEDNEE